MLELLKNLTKEIANLEERFKKNSDFISNVAASIEKLGSDKVNAIADSHLVTGALQAYKNVEAELKKGLGIVDGVLDAAADAVEEVVETIKDAVEGN